MPVNEKAPWTHGAFYVSFVVLRPSIKHFCEKLIDP